MSGIDTALVALRGDVPAIGKDARNVAQGYAARSIDQMYDELGPLFAKHGVLTLPTMELLHREWVESRQGTQMAHVWVKVTLTLRAEDGSEVVASAVSEGRDASDKATNKAFSGAMKYLLINLLLIPVTGDTDPDLHHSESVANQQTAHQFQTSAVVAAKLEVVRYAKGNKGLAAQAWADTLSYRGIVDDSEIEPADLPAIVTASKNFVDEAAKVEDITPGEGY